MSPVSILPPKNVAVSVDDTTREVFVRGKPARLAPKEYDVLAILLRARGSIVSREQILKTIWGPDAPLDKRIVDQHVARLRRGLREEAMAVITVTNSGYRVSKDVAFKSHATDDNTARVVEVKRAFGKKVFSRVVVEFTSAIPSIIEGSVLRVEQVR